MMNVRRSARCDGRQTRQTRQVREARQAHALSAVASDVPSTGKRRYSIKLWKTFTDCFNCLPVAAVVDEKIICMHGGLSPDLQQLSQIQRIMRPTDVPDQGLLCDLLWSDPDKDVQGWGENDRGERDPAPSGRAPPSSRPPAAVRTSAGVCLLYTSPSPRD